METYYHRLQIALLHELVHQLFKGRNDYYDIQQAKEIIEYVHEQRAGVRYKGPDFFVVLGVDGAKKRKSWVVWNEGGSILT